MGKIVFLTKHTVIFLYAVFLLCLGILHENLEAGKIDKKVIVLGLDGMDPVILERMLGQGKLPNFNYLKVGCDCERQVLTGSEICSCL